jgi:hypothetical protein
MILHMARLFMSQAQMDRWTSEGKIKLEDDVMHLPALNRSFQLSSAVLFENMVDGQDVHSLIGKVKTLDQLTGMGAEHYGNSVILGEVGYECVEGFVGIPVEAGGVGGSGLLRLGG